MTNLTAVEALNIKDHTELAAQVAAQADEIERLRNAIRRICLEAHETIPSDGRVAAFSALNNIGRMATAALTQSEVR